MTQKLTITQPDDWHVHLRDGEILKTVAPHTARQFGRAMVMPNLQPPVTSVDMAMSYRQRILSSVSDNLEFSPLMSLYLTDNTPVDEVKRAADCPEVVGFKLYPAGATTNSSSGVTSISKVMPVLESMAELGVILQIHGEVTDKHVDVFDREAEFIDQILQPLCQEIPELRIIFEHITTRQAAEFVQQGDADRIAATITPQHLMFNRNEIFRGGIRPHNYCLPILKRETHRAALVEAAISGDRRFFLGTDSAPHSRTAKQSDCGCAGCYSAGTAMELYAEVFYANDALHMLEGFSSIFGAQYYGVPVNETKITLEQVQWTLPSGYLVDKETNDEIVPLCAGETLHWRLIEQES